MILRDEPIGDAPVFVVVPERGEAGRGAVASDERECSVPAPAGGMADDLTVAAHSYLTENALHLMYEAERARTIARIDGYLHNCGSPMEGMGRYIVETCAPTGVSPTLVVAIAQGESNAGLRCFAPYNYWGGLAYPGGFGSWEESISAHVSWLHKYFGAPQTAYDCPGYCIPDHPWMDNVDSVRRSI